MAYRACDGFPVNTGWFTMHPVIRGAFNSPTAKFNPAEHTVVFDIKQGPLLRKELASVDVQILGVADTALFIAQVTDVKTGNINETLTSNRNLRISGSKIKIAGDNPDNGIFFINVDTQERIMVDPSDVVNNNPSELIIVIPELPAGTYQVGITSQYTPSTLLKEPRTHIFDRLLTVDSTKPVVGGKI
jgi:hypothetical protein